MTATMTKQPSIYSAAEPFDQALEELERKGHRIITLAEDARLRIQESPSFDSSRDSNHTREGFIYRPKESPLLVRISPILDNPSEATEAHRNDRDFYPTEESIERAIASGSYKLPRTDFSIPTNRFKEEGLPVFAFGTTEGKNKEQDEKDAEEYGSFLRENGIKEMHVWLVGKGYVDKQERPFARQLWFFGRLGGRSGLFGDWFLGYFGRVRGVPKTGEAAAQKIGTHTLRQPTLERILTTVKPFVIEHNREELERKLRSLYE